MKLLYKIVSAFSKTIILIVFIALKKIKLDQNQLFFKRTHRIEKNIAVFSGPLSAEIGNACCAQRTNKAHDTPKQTQTQC